MFQKNADYVYTPVDISAGTVASMKNSLMIAFPGVRMEPHAGDFFRVLPYLLIDASSKLILPLGATIGNYTKEEALGFTTNLRKHMHPGDKILIGFNLRNKRPTIHFLPLSCPYCKLKTEKGGIL